MRDRQPFPDGDGDIFCRLAIGQGSGAFLGEYVGDNYCLIAPAAYSGNGTDCVGTGGAQYETEGRMELLNA